MITLYLTEIWEHSDIADRTQNTSSQAISLSRLSKPLYLEAVLEKNYFETAASEATSYSSLDVALVEEVFSTFTLKKK